MGTYKIAPVSTGQIGMSKMKYGLVNKADYSNSAGVSTEIKMSTLVTSPTSYQGDLTSKTWNTATPYKFSEMYGQTWQDAVASVLSYTFIESGGVGTFYIQVNGTTVASGTSNAAGTINASVGDTIKVYASHSNTNNPSLIEAGYRQPGGSGTYTTLFFQSNLNGTYLSNSNTFTVTQTTVDIYIDAGGL